MAERIPTIPQESVKWNVPPEFEGITAYNPRHDIQDFLDLAALQGKISPEEFAQRQAQTINRTKRQLEKTLGERFRVRSSQVEYFIKDGILKSPDYPGPVIQEYEKGRRFLEDAGSTETGREEAEIRGMRKLENIFASFGLQEDEKVIIVSPKGPMGTLYNDNIFYVYGPKDDKIVMTRYYSSLSLEGFFKAIETLDTSINSQQPQELNEAYFLERPTVTNLSVDQIMETFAIDVDTQLEKDQQEILEACLPFIQYYIRVLAENSLGFEEIKKAINTIYNVADEAENKLKTAKRIVISEMFQQFRQQTAKAAVFVDVRQSVNFYGIQPVRSVSFGCPGGQKGFSVYKSPFLSALAYSIGARSIVDFAPFAKTENEDKSDFPCPRCGYIITYGAGIKKCPGCDLEATCS